MDDLPRRRTLPRCSDLPAYPRRLGRAGFHLPVSDHSERSSAMVLSEPDRQPGAGRPGAGQCDIRGKLRYWRPAGTCGVIIFTRPGLATAGDPPAAAPVPGEYPADTPTRRSTAG